MFGIFPARRAKHKSKILLASLLLLFRIVIIYAQDSVLGKSVNFLNLLSQNEISCEKLPLLDYESQDFPFNISVKINSSAVSENTESLSVRNHLIFSFTQNFAIKHSSVIINFIKQLEQKNFPFEIELFFSANDDTPLSSEIEKYNEGGTFYFIANNVNSDSSFAIVVEEDYRNHIKIYSGSSDIAPLWLFKSVKEACLEKSSKRIISTSFFSFYQKGYFQQNRRVTAYLDEHIPALSISSDGSQETFDILMTAAEKLSHEDKDKWERHYDFFTVGRKTFCLNESIFSTFYIILAVIIFSVLCFLTFRGSHKFRTRLKAVLQIWYIIPEFVILNYLLFYLSSLLFSFFSFTPQVVFPIEFLLTIFIPVFLINIQIHHFQNRYYFALSIIMLLSGIINVFIFANFDISLIILFFIEYLILLISTYIKNPLLLILFLFLQIIPFAPYLIDILNFASVDGIQNMLSPNLLQIFVYSTIIFNIQLQILRIIFAFNNFSKTTIVINKQKIQARFFIIAIFILFCIFFIYSTSIIFKTNYSTEQEKTYTVEQKPVEHIFYSIKDSPFMDMTSHNLCINSSVDVLRYIVKIEHENSVPLYDSNFAYTLINPHTASFSLPDNPGRKIEIVYITDNASQSKITIDAYYSIDEETTGKETIAFITDSENNISKGK